MRTIYETETGRFHTGTIVSENADGTLTILVDANAGGATTVTGREFS